MKPLVDEWSLHRHSIADFGGIGTIWTGLFTMSHPEKTKILREKSLQAPLGQLD